MRVGTRDTSALPVEEKPVARRVRVLRLRPGHAPEVAEIEQSLQSYQREVGGTVDAIHLSDRIDLLINDEGIMKKLPPLGLVYGHEIRGVALAVGCECAGTSTLTDTLVAKVLAAFVPAGTSQNRAGAGRR